MSRFFKKKSDFSKTVVILDITIFLLYVITNIVMQWLKGYSMPTDINAGVFAFLTSELGILSFIKRSKLVAESKTQICSNIINNTNTNQGAG